MTTATLERPKRKGEASTNGHAGRASNGAAIAADAEAGADGRYAGVVQIAIEQIGREQDHNPRHDFSNRQALEELAASIRTHGVLQPLIVRPARPGAIGDSKRAKSEDASRNQKFWIVAGERRWQAATLAGLDTVPCVVRALSDRDAKEIAIVENLQREDLNAIDEAAGFEGLVALGVPQSSIAQRIGCDPSHVSNRLRLLKLPPVLRARVISREMTPTQARDCVPLAVSAGVVKAIEAALKRHDGDLPLSTDEWQRLMAYDVLHQHAAKMDRRDYVYDSASATSLNVPAITPSDEERERLNVVTFAGSDYALNRKLFNELYEKHKKTAVARLEEKTKKAKAATKGKQSPQATAADAKRDAKRKQDELAGRVLELKRAWLLDLVAERVAACNDWPTLARLAFVLHGERERHDREGLYYGNNGFRIAGDDDLTLWHLTTAKRPAELAKWFAAWLATFFDGGSSVTGGELLTELVKFFKVNEEAAWRRGKLGERTEKFYQVHNAEQLVALGNELGLLMALGKPKRVHLQQLLGQTKALPYPAILKTATLV